MEEQGSMCESCGVERGRYKCPGCGLRSCSVQCVKRHKTERRCEGKRSKTNYVSLSEFTTSHLLSDYYFLEEAGRMIDSAHRGLQNIGRDTRERRQRLQRVRTAARKRGISLQLCPQGMLKHQANTSCTTWNRDRRDWGIQWRVRLVFPLAGQEFNEDRVSEDKSLENLLKRYIHPTESNPVIRHRLKRYVGQEVAVFLKVEKTNSATYCQIQPQSSLREILRDRTVIEFPELHITLSSAPTDYLGSPLRPADYQGSSPQAAHYQGSPAGELQVSRDATSSLATLAANYESSSEGT